MDKQIKNTQPQKENWELLYQLHYPNLYQYQVVYKNPTDNSNYNINVDALLKTIQETGILNGITRHIYNGDTSYVDESNPLLTREALKRQYKTGQHYPRYLYLPEAKTKTPEGETGLKVELKHSKLLDIFNTIGNTVTDAKRNAPVLAIRELPEGDEKLEFLKIAPAASAIPIIFINPTLGAPMVTGTASLIYGMNKLKPQYNTLNTKKLLIRQNGDYIKRYI